MATYTYSFDPSTTPKDAVRFLCQDTDVTPGIVRLADEEINWMLAQQSNVFMCAADAAESIAAYWSGQQDKSIGPLKLTRGAIFQRYLDLATALRRQADRNAGAIVVFYPVGKPGYENDGPRHIFRIGIDDIPGTFFNWPPFDMPPVYTYP